MGISYEIEVATIATDKLGRSQGLARRFKFTYIGLQNGFAAQSTMGGENGNPSRQVEWLAGACAYGVRTSPQMTFYMK